MLVRVLEKYLSAVPQKTILYNDFQFFQQNLTNIVLGSFANPIFTQGISRPQAFLLIRQLSASVHGSTIAGLISGTYVADVRQLGIPMNSPFSSSPGTCCSFSRVSNFKVFVSGVAVFNKSCCTVLNNILTKYEEVRLFMVVQFDGYVNLVVRLGIGLWFYIRGFIL
jgi:hypothetical protein